MEGKVSPLPLVAWIRISISGAALVRKRVLDPALTLQLNLGLIPRLGMTPGKGGTLPSIQTTQALISHHSSLITLRSDSFNRIPKACQSSVFLSITRNNAGEVYTAGGLYSLSLKDTSKKTTAILLARSRHEYIQIRKPRSKIFRVSGDQTIKTGRKRTNHNICNRPLRYTL